MFNKYSIYYITNIFVHLIVYLFFIIQTFKNHLRYSLKTVIFGAIVYALLATTLTLLFFEYDAPFSHTTLSQIVFTLFIVMTILVCSLLTTGCPFQMIFIILVTVNIQSSIIIMAKIIARIYFLENIFLFKHLAYLLVTMGLLLLYCPIMWYLYLVLFKRVIDLNIQYSYWSMIMLIPLMYLIYYRSSNYGGLPVTAEISGADLLAQVLLHCSGLLTYIVTLKMLLKTYESMKESEQVLIMRKQLEMQKIVYQNIRENSEKTARLQHDFHHHLLTISGLIQNKDIERLTTYLQKYISEWGTVEKPLCSNASVDVILRYYMAMAKREGISFNVNANIPEKISISDADLCVVFGNLLENTLTACMNDKKTGTVNYINTIAEKKGEQLFIHIENNFNGVIMEQKGQLLSSKISPSGLGLKSVKEIAEKTGGCMQFSFTDSVFKVQVHLNNEYVP